MDWHIAVFVGSGCCSGLKEDCIFFFLYFWIWTLEFEECNRCSGVNQQGLQAEGAQRGPVLVGTLFMVAEAYLLPLPTADPGTWAPMSPAQVRPGCVLWTRWRPRRGLEP